MYVSTKYLPIYSMSQTGNPISTARMYIHNITSLYPYWVSPKNRSPFHDTNKTDSCNGKFEQFYLFLSLLYQWTHYQYSHVSEHHIADTFSPSNRTPFVWAFRLGCERPRRVLFFKSCSFLIISRINAWCLIYMGGHVSQHPEQYVNTINYCLLIPDLIAMEFFWNNTLRWFALNYL